jgi:hypothetical protein
VLNSNTFLLFNPSEVICPLVLTMDVTMAIGIESLRLSSPLIDHILVLKEV